MQKVPEIFVVAGEPSADRHAALLGEALRRSTDVSLRGIGQSRMSAAGYELLFDSSGWSGIGVVESLRRVPKLLGNMRTAARHLLSRPPDLLVLVDFGAFNVRLARRLRPQFDCPILYYFQPGSWSRRADYTRLSGLVDHVASPFSWSTELLQRAGVEATWVGHPVLDRIAPPGAIERAELRSSFGLNDDNTIIGLLPGSRATELRCNGPQMLAAAATICSRIPNTHILLSAASNQAERRLREMVRRAGLQERVTLVPGVAKIARAADLAIVSSGTATLEVAAAICPMIVVYVGTSLMSLEKRIRRFSIPHIGMPNIVAGEEVVPELVDRDARGPTIARVAIDLLTDDAAIETMRERLLQVREELGTPGVSDRVAALALDMIGKVEVR